jgi:hypothetical protein
MRRAAWVSLLATCLSACSNTSELAVDLRTDLVPGLEFDAVRTELDGVLAPLHPARPEDASARSWRVAEFADVTMGTHDVRVQVLYAGVPVLTRRVVVRLDGSLVVTVVLTRDCRGVVCPGDGGPTETECLSGECGDPMCSPETPERCPAPECDEDADCAASVDCVTARCEEGTCLQRAEPDACPPEEICAPDAGCVPRPPGTCFGAGAPCRPRSESCESGHYECRGDALVCVVDGPAAAGMVCRPGYDPCVDPAVCDGVRTDCPRPTTLPDGTDCSEPEHCGGTCVGGSCAGGLECAAGESCSPCSTGSACLPTGTSCE